MPCPLPNQYMLHNNNNNNNKHYEVNFAFVCVLTCISFVLNENSNSLLSDVNYIK